MSSVSTAFTSSSSSAVQGSSPGRTGSVDGSMALLGFSWCPTATAWTLGAASAFRTVVERSPFSAGEASVLALAVVIGSPFLRTDVLDIGVCRRDSRRLMVNLQMTARSTPEFLSGKVKRQPRRSALVAEQRVQPRRVAGGSATTAEGRGVVPLVRVGSTVVLLLLLDVGSAVGARLRPQVADHVGCVGRLGPPGLERLDLAPQVVGEVRAVCRLEVAQRRHRGRQVVPLPLQVAEHLATPRLDLAVELLGPAQGVRLHPLRVY